MIDLRHEKDLEDARDIMAEMRKGIPDYTDPICPNCGCTVEPIENGLYKCPLEFDENDNIYYGCGQVSEVKNGLLIKQEIKNG